MIERLKKLCNMLRVKHKLAFSWEVSEKEGVWILTKSTLSNSTLDLISKDASHWRFALAEWIFTAGQFNIRLEPVTI
jgi:hypothetical protein